MPEEIATEKIVPIETTPIVCPACQSRITSDGKVLSEKSSMLEKLELRAESCEEFKTLLAEERQKNKKLREELDQILEPDKPQESEQRKSKLILFRTKAS